MELVDYNKIMEAYAKMDEKPKNSICRDMGLKAIRAREYDVPALTYLYYDEEAGCYWIEAGEYLPLAVWTYDDSEMKTFFSVPCEVWKADGKFTRAVFVSAYCIRPRNDGTLNQWEGWVEIPDNQKLLALTGWLFVEGIFKGNTIDVQRWHYDIPDWFPENLRVAHNGFETIENKEG